MFITVNVISLFELAIARWHYPKVGCQVDLSKLGWSHWVATPCRVELYQVLERSRRLVRVAMGRP